LRSKRRMVDVPINELAVAVRDGDGHLYGAKVFGRRRADGTWIGWIEFTPLGSGGLTRRTRRETTQPSEEALRYWASGIEPLYLEGALERAIRRPQRLRIK